ncbi:mannitol dehydrogenase family protein [Magnetospira sp. QH-2]|uniref:mannitol dehydrogenase family protein n=1 Tax=Magnetospira sp. (strain QH-2) TaxID=1288970 RepID=UPI0003E817E1|nr:mannitol dehydrogenase family protein [Magnetospira sp. QH-2]CCQ72153.1 Mannitol 2-dehydrogenase [Magnetospira sp. QH-2]
MAATKLNQNNLPALSATVSVPGYDRSALTPGILHIGVGNFHRAHQAIYLDRLFNLGSDHDWAIVGAGVRPHDAKTRELLSKQDWLTTVIELDPAGNTAVVCGSMIDFLPVDPSALIEAMTHPGIRIVSLTVTEGGYYINTETGGFDAAHPDMVHDRQVPARPRSVFGMLLAGLRQRRLRGLPPFTIVSCDNLPENGDVTRRTMVGLAEAQSAELGEWIASEIAFPNGMVDCITPATGDRELKLAETEFGIEDASPVVCEPFHQWVLEDNFPAGRPALEKVGVEFVDDVAPYELMKLRILNGGHGAIAYAGALLGHRYVHDAMSDPLIRGYLHKLAQEEIIPTIPAIPGIDFQLYLETVLDRFANPKIGDTIARLCLDGSNRQPKFILPTLTDRLEAGQSIDGLALEVALWCRYCMGETEDGWSITLEDESADQLMERAHQAKTHPTAFLENTDIFGGLGDNKTFAETFSRALLSLLSNGVARTLRTYGNGGPQ